MQEEQLQTEKKQKSSAPNFKVFDRYDLSEIEIKDIGLKTAITLTQRLTLKNQGRNVEKYGQARVNIIERLANRVAVSGHRGKKHKIILGHVTGKFTKNMKTVLEAFKVIEKKTGKNPVEVFIRAMENSAPKDEVTTIEYGGAKYPQAVDVAPIRRVNLALRWIAHGSSDRAFGKKKSIVQGLAEEIMLAADGNMESFAVKKRTESEKQADSAR